MTNLLVLKEQLRELYSRYGNYIRPVVKFLMAVIAFSVINNRLGFDPRLSGIPVVIGLSVVCAALPYSAITVIAGMLAVGQVLAVAPIIAAVILVVYIIMYCLAVRYTKNLAVVLLAIPILYVMKIPFVVPILLGMVATPAAALPTACGVIIYYLFYGIKQSASVTMGTSMEDSLSLYKLVIDNSMANHEMLFFVVLFVVALLITYFIRKRNIDHAFEAANAAGTVVCILGVLLGKLVLDISGSTLVLLSGSVISGCIVFVICYFRMTLDYSAAEQLQFEDDDYYYYVKAVPKMKMTAPEKNVKRINPQKASGNSQNQRAARENLRRGNEETVYLRKAVEDDLDRELEDSGINKFDI